MMKIRRGTVWPWVTLIDPPDGWEPLPNKTRFLISYPIGIVATRDHDEPPSLPEQYIPSDRSKT